MSEPDISYPRPEPGQIEVPAVALLAYIGIGLLSLSFLCTLVLAALPGSNITEEGGQSVVVTATVPLFFKINTIYGSSALGMVVSGNYKNGFVAQDNNGKTLFDYSKMPGDGVMVKINSTYKRVIFVPKY